MTEDRFLEVFRVIEDRTKAAEENNINKRLVEGGGPLDYPLTSPARMEMTDMYNTLKSKGIVQVFGIAAEGNYPAQGTKIVTPVLLEKITGLSMVSLTPKPTNTLLLAGVALAVFEGILSLTTGIELNFLIFITLFIAFLDKLLINGAIFETITRIAMPEYTAKIIRHEAGHFLCAYLLGCPVEGCVLSTWAALNDARFGGKRTSVNAGTSFFDASLSNEINGLHPLTRASIDRYSVIVMGGIAAEALNFGRADGGAGDEIALVSFLSNLNPRSGGAMSWNIHSIKNQARWGALQAVLLIREYRPCYDALVDALERGCDLGACVYAIESAAKENGLPSISEKPLGYIVDQGMYGDWVTEPQMEPKTIFNTAVTQVAPTNKSSDSSDDDLMSLEALKTKMEEKLKEIDSKLESL
eukprot:CAMPEP_0176478194 /NCGR_PEP_ID=MMETSP0200_2-20121128/1052_1 /TAXON_ID=947934 /ORGANISM="Chaetoceros sp., Strain GSL56" /LENGTH=412 /DNA_ID=CAMNT_0017874107 /DNA_START=326 /DNA_END=1564 /DNA_ORIENTATION=-